MAAAPDRIAIETPRGNIRAGSVTDERLVASAQTGPIRQYCVEIDGHGFWVPASEIAEPEAAPTVTSKCDVH